ncbi:BTB/POZ-like [Macleaya cordata]|uniref:BTB/POZ-like n=1 Tax=Macleaya cordata TaxID=56857 RepID=A0A200QXB9_MACCD|nr:BTB/POZ-like [Macleaya cordata]
MSSVVKDLQEFLIMETSSPKTSSLALSPFSSPNVGALLKIKIIAWSQETGLPVSVHVRVGDKVYDLHKHPLLAKSGYFKRALLTSTDIELPHNFPGGSDVFEMVALFSYSSSTLIDPFNVAALRCAAEFLEMTEEYGSGNLCERSDLYLNQVVLQNWDDTLIVLQKCQTLLPLSEELLIVSRCVESLAFMGCMEILDPEHRRERPVVTLETMAGRAWSCETVKEIAAQDLWIKDLIALPFRFFERIIRSLRRQGMKEKYVSPIIVFYANKWVLSKKTHQFWESTERSRGDDANNKVSIILQGILELTPTGEKASRIVPVGFYFALLARALELGLSSDRKAKLQDQIASVLHLAVVDDFLLPASGTESISSSVELATMESIILTCLSLTADIEQTPSDINCVVAELWDKYLSQIAPDPNMEAKRFMDLIEMVPISYRQTHDHLYRALNNFLSEHRNITQEEKTSVCKYLNCQKLSQEICIEAVQNELMPLRLIVQALFVQQLNTHQAFKNCSDSFRYEQYADFSGSLWSSRYANPMAMSQVLGETPYKEANGEETAVRPLGFLMQKDLAMQRSEFSRSDYESTSFRIQTLEQELVSLKRSLQWQTIYAGSEPIFDRPEGMRPFGLEGRSSSKKRNPLGQVTSCIGSVSFSSQRKYANRILKVFRRITLLGRGKPNRKPKPGASVPWPK